MQKRQRDTSGDSGSAERLRWLSHAFDSATVAYVRNAVRRPLRCCLDLGAGAGFLSRSLHQALECARTVGLESSAPLVALGQYGLPSGVELLQHDVTQSLPVRADLVVSRFLLGRLRDPLGALAVWRDSEPVLLVLEEVAGVFAEQAALTRYAELSALVQRAAGRAPYIGGRLAELAEAGGFAIESARAQRLELPIEDVARQHARHLPALSRRDVVRAHFTPRELGSLQRSLEALAAGAAGSMQVEVVRCRAVLA